MVIEIITSIRELPGDVLYRAFTGSLSDCQAAVEKCTWLDYVNQAYYHTARHVLYVPVARREQNEIL